MTKVRLTSIPNSLTGQKNWESLYDPELRTCLVLMEKSKPRANTSPVFGGYSGTANWSSAPNFAFADNTSVIYTTGKKPYEIVFGTKPQIPMSLKLGLYRNKHNICCSEFCKDLPSH